MQEKEPQEEAAPDPGREARIEQLLSPENCLSSVVPDPPVSWPGGPRAQCLFIMKLRDRNGL